MAGALRVRLFNTIEEADQPRDVLRFWTRGIEGERAAIKVQRRIGGRERAGMGLADRSAIAAGSFHVEAMRSIALADGSTMYYVEESKAPLDDCEVHVRATVAKSASGRLRLTAMRLEPRCDNYVNLNPIAILERGAAACWITEQQLEDGAVLTLTMPGIRYAFARSSCAMESGAARRGQRPAVVALPGADRGVLDRRHDDDDRVPARPFTPVGE